jgi:hypothetical protein
MLGVPTPAHAVDQHYYIIIEAQVGCRGVVVPITKVGYSADGPNQPEGRKRQTENRSQLIPCRDKIKEKETRSVKEFSSRAKEIKK